MVDMAGKTAFEEYKRAYELIKGRRLATWEA